MNAVEHVGAFLAFCAEYRRFKELSGPSGRFPVLWRHHRAFVKEKTAQSDFDRHYIYHTAWAARMVRDRMPAYHVDISSSLYFCSIVSAFVPVRFYEFRPPELLLPGLTTAGASLSALPFPANSVESLSCMHVVEHAGLGRYGDPIDPDGDLKAIDGLKRVLAPRGSLLFVAPVGRPLLRFNSHRTYSYAQIVDYFGGLSLYTYAFIPEHPSQGPMQTDPPLESRTTGQDGCGCFGFTK